MSLLLMLLLRLLLLLLLPRREEEDEDGDSCRILGLASCDAAASMVSGDCWKPARGDLLL